MFAEDLELIQAEEELRKGSVACVKVDLVFDHYHPWENESKCATTKVLPKFSRQRPQGAS